MNDYMSVVIIGLLLLFGFVSCSAITDNVPSVVATANAEDWRGYANDYEKIQFIQSLTREEAITLLITIQSTCHYDACTVALYNAMKAKQGAQK